MLPGFGVGTFHFDDNVHELSNYCTTFSVDLLGQGKSWPESDILPDMQWRYSVDNWRDQIIHFIEEVIGSDVHLAGNSLGGFLAVMVASKRPDLVKSLVLLNPAPFWGFLPHSQQLVWNGTLPAPKQILQFGGRYFDVMRNPSTVNTMLSQVYHTKTKIDDALIQNIIDSAKNCYGHEAFTSILFSPKSELSFEDMLVMLECPVCQINGREDPWITPFWSQRIKRILPLSYLIELSPCGHCPHHECPEIVNSLLVEWIRNVDELSPVAYPRLLRRCADISDDIKCELVDGAPRNFVEHLGETLHRLQLLLGMRKKS